MSADYSELAARFDERYRYQSFPGIAARLRQMVDHARIRVLEVGCGTGHWLSVLSDLSVELIGVDPSPAMLDRARTRVTRATLVCASAEYLPFQSNSLDLIFCVNAFHHFSDPQKFLADSRRLLRTGGRLAIAGLDPHLAKMDWYLYDYFAGLREMDLARYLPHREIMRLMVEAGFRNAVAEAAEHIQKTFVGDTVLSDPFLERTSTSQSSA